MKMRIDIIRHGKTKGNLDGRYIGGRTDEPLCEVGKKELVKRTEEGSMFYVSPMIRCKQTLELLFSPSEYKVVEELREIDFGEFENQNYEELKEREDYQAWVDGAGKLDFPGGEPLGVFQNRNREAMEKIIKDLVKQKKDKAVVVCHGGSIMAIMNWLTNEDYYSFQVKNGHGYALEFIKEGNEIVDLSYHSI